MIIGEIIFPNNSPNLIQSLFNGVKILELIKPSKRKITPINKDQKRISPEFNKGQNPMTKKNNKKYYSKTSI